MANIDKIVDEIKSFILLSPFNLDLIKQKTENGLLLTIPVHHNDFCFYVGSRESLVQIKKRMISLYQDKFINENYSFKEFQKVVMKNVYEVLRGVKLGYESIRELFRGEPKDYLIVRSLEGIQVSGISRLSSFEIFHTLDELVAAAQEILKSEIKPSPEIFFNVVKFPCVGTKVQSMGEDKAREKANVLFRLFENVIQFMVGRRWDEFYVRVVAKDVLISDQSVCMSSAGISMESAWRGPLGRENDYSLDDKYFISEENSMIWDLIKKNNRSDWEEKLVRSINWIGRGLRNDDLTMSFLQMLVSLECLLVFDAPEFLSESITAKMSDGVAYVLADDKEKRLSIVKTMKGMYGLRSKVVHAGKEGISASQLIELFSISRAVLISFFHAPDLRQINNATDFLNWFNNKKYC